MTEETNVAGMPEAAPRTAAENAKKIESAKDGPMKSKVMVLAVFQDASGEIKICPIDVEHEDDDQRDLTVLEMVTKKNLSDAYAANECAMKKALGSLFTIFDQRLYRENFRTFENFCFAIFDTHRISEIKTTKARARVKKLEAELEGQI